MQLFLDKHADFIAAYGKKKDDYVSKIFYVMVWLLHEWQLMSSNSFSFQSFLSGIPVSFSSK